MYTILYTDDEAGLLEIGKIFLESTGDFSVRTALSAEEAFHVIADVAVDCIVADYQMPVMDGIAFLKALRKAGNAVPFILFTGRGREQVVIEALNNGADYYLQKGGDPTAQFAELSHKIRLAIERSRTARELAESERRYRAVVEDQTEYITRFLPDGTHIFVNNAYCRFLGLKPEEILGKRFPVRLPEEDARMVAGRLAALTPAQPYVTLENRVLMPDGSVRWHQWIDRAIFDEGGTVVEYQSVGRDITDRKKAEEDLRAAYDQLAAAREELHARYTELRDREQEIRLSERKLQGIVHGSPIPQFVIDRDHRVVIWNRALEDVRGVKAGEVVGTTDAWKAFYPEKRPVLAELLVDGTPEKIPAYYPGTYAPSPYGEGAYEATGFFPSPGKPGVWLHFTAAAIRDGEGAIIGAVETLEDITARKNAQEALAESEERLRAFMDSATDAYTIWDADLRLIEINRAGLAFLPKGAKKENLLGKNIAEFMAKSDEPGYLDRYREVIRTGVPFSGSGRVVEQPAARRWVDITCFRVGNGLGIVTRDITQEKEAQDKLRSAYEQIAASEEELRSQYDELRAGEQTIRENEKFLETLIENIPDMIFVKDAADLRFVRFNRAGEDLLGYSRAELVGKSDHDLFPAAQAGFFTARDREVLARGTMTDIPAETIRTRMKGERILHTKKIPVRDEEGNARFLLGISEDITEHRKADEALRESEKKFRDLFNNLTDAVYIHEILPEGMPGRLIEVNDVMCSRLGYTRDELLTMGIADIVSGGHREKIGGIRDLMAKVGFLTFEAEHRRKDGSIVPVEVNTNILVMGGRKVALAVARDISERKRAKAALEKSERMYRTVVETANEGIWIIDTGFRTVSANRKMQELFGYTEEEMRGRPVWDFVPPDEAASMKEELAGRPRGVPGRYERRWVKKDGTIIWCLTSGTPLFAPDGTFAGSFGMFTDITDRRRAEEALRESEEKYRAIIENFEDTYYRTDRDGRLIMISPSGVRTMGYPDKAAMLGRPVREFYARPEEYEAIIGMIQAQGSVSNREVQLKKADGSVITALFTSHVYTGPDGSILGTEGIIRDISDRKAAENAMAAEQRFAETLIDTIPGFFYVLDTRGKLLRWNECLGTISGYGHEAIGRMALEDFVAPEDRENIGRAILQAFAKGRAAVPACMLTRDGRRIPTLFTVSATRISGEQALVGTGTGICGQPEESSGRGTGPA